MEIETRDSRDETTLYIRGRITVADVDRLKNTVETLMRDGRRRLVLDLSGVTYIDSAGLGELVQTYVTSRNHGGNVRIEGLNSRTRDLLKITRILTVFHPDDERQKMEDFDREVQRSFKAVSPARVVLILGVVLSILFALYAYLERTHS